MDSIRSVTSSSSSTYSVAAVDTDIPPLEEKYDVFISFRGDETRDSFTSHLHKALLRKNIETYMDDRLEKGDDIGTALLEAIGRSKIALVIFSKNYASSTWCLKELVHILRCKKNHGKIVIPIFYGIDPSDVRKQQGTYALEDRPLKRSRDEVANWRAALEEAANIAGFHDSRKTGRTEADFVEEVVQDVLTKVNMSRGKGFSQDQPPARTVTLMLRPKENDIPKLQRKITEEEEMKRNEERDSDGGSSSKNNICQNEITATNGATDVGVSNIDNYAVQGKVGSEGKKGFPGRSGGYNISGNKIKANKARNVGVHNIGNTTYSVPFTTEEDHDIPKPQRKITEEEEMKRNKERESDGSSTTDVGVSNIDNYAVQGKVGSEGTKGFPGRRWLQHFCK
ncbi:unnamed protein product [Prunus brigantina]